MFLCSLLGSFRLYLLYGGYGIFIGGGGGRVGGNFLFSYWTEKYEIMLKFLVGE